MALRTMLPEQKINTMLVWSWPRTRSTMLERCFIAHPQVKAGHEPMSQAYHIGPERLRDWYYDPNTADGQASLAKYKDLTFDAVWRSITDPPPGKVCFSKDQARGICPPISLVRLPTARSEPEVEQENPTLMRRSQLFAPNIIHVFLIRNPAASFPSYHKACIKASGDFSETGFGIAEACRLFDYMHEVTGKIPLVIDSDDLVKQPKVVLQYLCKLLGIELDEESMLDWDKSKDKADELFSVWPLWHEDAATSSTIHSGYKGNKEVQVDMPAEIQELVKKYTPAYKRLKAHAVQFERAA